MIFGYFIKKKHCVVQEQLCRCVMSLEIKGSSSSGIAIRANGTSLNFTPREFAIVTELNCVSNRFNFVLYENVPNRIVERLTADGKFYLIQGMPLAIHIGDEKMDETNLSDSQFKILDEMLPCLNAYRRESITAHPSTNREEELTDEHLNDKNSESVVEDHCQLRIRRPSKFKESPYMSKFGSAAGSSARHIRIFPQKYPFVYHSIDGIVDTKIVKKFMDWISVDLLKGHAKRWIFLYDSYESSGHYPTILAEIRKLAEIIPLCLQACDFYDKKGIDLQNHPRYKDKDSSDLFEVLFEDNFPQQPSESLDCGLYIVTYAECLSYGHKVLLIEFDPNALRTRYAALLWDYGIRKQEANAHSDFEAPLRPAKKIE
ncbi:hypothetical protein FXO38_33509 [Capsicum annuum]|nr:hypothetical protein FXO38_33509 [Capsicum annuum]